MGATEVRGGTAGTVGVRLGGGLLLVPVPELSLCCSALHVITCGINCLSDFW
jgi:hypothetical protein